MTIEKRVTSTGFEVKGPGFIAHMYGSRTGRWQSNSGPVYGERLREHALAHLYAQRIQSMNFETIEARVLAYFSGHDPRNHVGKYADRRIDK